MKIQKLPDGTEIHWDGKHYDADNSKYAVDIPFYLSEACKARGPVLEIACGTGRLTIPLAKAGIDVTGLDITKSMLDAAKLKARSARLKIKWLRADCRSFHLSRKFKLIFIPFNSMLHLHEQSSLTRFFDCVKKHLLPGGRFILDIFNPDPCFIAAHQGKEYPIGKYTDPYTGKQITETENYFYDRAMQGTNNTWNYYSGGKLLYRRRLRMRCFYPQELEMLLSCNGFKVIRKYGDFNRAPFKSESRQQIIVAARQR